jgi:predicted nucleic acid-binding protein
MKVIEHRMSFLVDTNIILDIVTEDHKWFTWSSSTLSQCAEEGKLWINPIIYAEVSVGFSHIEELDDVLPPTIFHRASLPWEASFLAGKCFLRYRRAAGNKTTPLPDCYIGAHAAVSNFTLITRDRGRFHTYFPQLKIICP